MEMPHVRARITMLPNADGGRRSPIFSGYRPQFRYLGRDNDVSVELLNQETLFPGSTTDVMLTFLRPEFRLRRIAIDTGFELAEVARRVCRGTVIEVLPADLQAAP